MSLPVVREPLPSRSPDLCSPAAVAVARASPTPAEVSCEPERAVFSSGASLAPRTPVWFWFHLLSLDAPLVACLWAAVFARAFRATLAPAELVSLGVAVWLIYVSDRLLDGYAFSGGALRERHRFVAHHRVALLAALAGLATASTALVVPRLAAPTVRSGVSLLIVVGIYFLCVHRNVNFVWRFLPKELAVGLLFAAGTALPVAMYRRSPLLILSVLLFASLCTLNCVAIESWESSHTTSHASAASFAKWAGHRFFFLSAAFVFSCGAAALSVPDARVRLFLAALAAGGILLAALDRQKRRVTPRAQRVLADVALVIPAVLFLLVFAR